MRLQTVPASRGAHWAREGIRTFFMRPGVFAGMIGILLFGILFVRLVPALAFLVLPLAPMVTLAFMIATRAVREGGKPTLGVYLQPLRAERPRVIALLRLGLVYTVATFAIMWLGDLIASGGSEVLLESASDAASAPGSSPTMEIAAGPALGLLLQLALVGLLSIPFWHAPALVYWEGQGCAQAMFSSTLACWRNFGAFAVYAAVWFAYVMGLSLLMALLVSIAGQPQWLMLASAPLSLIVAALVYPSLYFTYADCFVSTDSEAATPDPINGAT